MVRVRFCGEMESGMRNVLSARALIAALALIAGLVPAVTLGSSSAQAAVTCPTLAANGAPSIRPAPNVDWDGCDLAGAELWQVDLSDASLVGADLSGASVWSTNLTDAKLAGANLTNADLRYTTLTRTGLTDASLAGADLMQADLNNADLAGATGLDSANVTNATWVNVLCPDITNSDYYTGGCTGTVSVTTPSATPSVTGGAVGANGWYTSAVTVSWHWVDANPLTADCPAATTSTATGASVQISATCTDSAGHTGTASLSVEADSAPPVVTLTGVRNGGGYAYPRFPTPSCTATDAVSGVEQEPALQSTPPAIPGSGLRPLDGVHKATCGPAVDWAGNRSAVTAPVRWTDTYLLGGFTAPKAGAVVSRSAKTLVVRTFFAQMPALEQAARAKARELRATLAGPGIKTPVTVTCGWNVTAKKIQCALPVPSDVKAGRKYALTVYENFGAGWLRVPPAAAVQNPESFSFK
jgi:uncharacterized protein YjbI with pentapeptide repeats